MIRTDAHMHTCFSHDSESTPETMVRGALERGLSAVCFTDHYDKDEFAWGPENIFDVEEYFRVLQPLKEKYRGQMKIRIGIEAGIRPHLGGFFERLVGDHPFDFVICSAHSLEGNDASTGIPFQNRPDEEVYHLMFQEMYEDIRGFSDFDVLGHMDYMVRYGKTQAERYSYQRFSEEIDAILRRVIELGKGIELNTAGWKYGLAFAHPHPDILKRYRKLGGEIITVGSDAHRPEHIAYDFAKASEVLEACGFRYYTEFQQRVPSFRKIM